MTSKAAGSSFVSKMRSVKEEASEMEPKEIRRVSIFSGRGSNRNVMSQSIPRLPMEPIMSLVIS